MSADERAKLIPMTWRFNAVGEPIQGIGIDVPRLQSLIANSIREAERAKLESVARYLEGLTTRKGTDGEWAALSGEERALIRLLADSVRKLPPA